MNISSFMPLSTADSADGPGPNKPVIRIGTEHFSAVGLFNKLQTHQLLPQLCREIIVDQSLSTLTLTPEEVNQGRQTVYQIHQIQADSDREAWMQQRGMTPERFEQWIQRQILLETFKRRRWGSEASSYFLKRKEGLDRAIYTLIRHSDRAVIQELFFRIQTNEDTMSNLSAQYSQGAEQQTYGLVGPVELGRVHPRVAQQLRKVKPGQVSFPLQLENWFVILRLETWLPAQYDFYTEQRLLDELFQQWLEQQLRQVELQGDRP
jgi:parvulin-like peptidyl-prolyl isomerase